MHYNAQNEGVLERGALIRFPSLARLILALSVVPGYVFMF